MQLVVLASLLAAASAQVIPMTPEFQNEFLDLHNDYRRNEGSSDMNKLVWNASIAEVVNDWLGSCEMKHKSAAWGENLYYETHTKDMSKAIKEGMKSWFEEKFLKVEGESCGMRCHYTQLVWAKSTQVGCAIRHCDPLQAFGAPNEDATYIGCFYFPKGNWVGESIYLKGNPCKECLHGQECEDKLCTGEGVIDPAKCVDTEEDCPYWAEIGECESNPNFMLKKCIHACGVCKGLDDDKNKDKGNKPCKDNNENCKTWLKYGECERNPVFMKKDCAKTCGAC